MNATKRNKYGAVFFAITVGTWLFAAVIDRTLSRHVAEIYGPEEDLPFTLCIWWHLLPWFALIALVVDYGMAYVFDSALSSRHWHAFKYLLFFGIAILFIILSCMPLVIVIEKQ